MFSPNLGGGMMLFLPHGPHEPQRTSPRDFRPQTQLSLLVLFAVFVLFLAGATPAAARITNLSIPVAFTPPLFEHPLALVPATRPVPPERALHRDAAPPRAPTLRHARPGRPEAQIWLDPLLPRLAEIRGMIPLALAPPFAS